MLYSQCLLRAFSEINFHLTVFLYSTAESGSHSAQEDFVRSLIKTEAIVLYTPQKEKDLHNCKQVEKLTQEFERLKETVEPLIGDGAQCPELNSIFNNLSYELRKYIN